MCRIGGWWNKILYFDSMPKDSKKRVRSPAQKAKRRANKKNKRGKAPVGSNFTVSRGQRVVIEGLGKYKEKKVGNKHEYGARLGGVLGEGASRLFHYLTGKGTYKIPKKNSLMHSLSVCGDPPAIVNSRFGEGKPMRHREYIGDLYTGTPVGGVTPFNLISFKLNPGNSQLFPWLANIAKNFQHWTPNGMIVELKSRSSSYAANVALGEVSASIDYNSLDPPPASLREMLNMEYAQSCKPSDSLIMPVECAPQNDVLTHLFVAKDNNYEGGDPLFFDLGTLFLATEGIPLSGNDPVPVSQIWVSYEFMFYKEILPPSGSLSFRGTFNNEAFNAMPLPEAVDTYCNSSNLIDIDSTIAGTPFADGIFFNPVASNKTFLVAINRSQLSGHAITETSAAITIAGTSGAEVFPELLTYQGIVHSSAQANSMYAISGGSGSPTLTYTEKDIFFLISFPFVLDPITAKEIGYGFYITTVENDTAFGFTDVLITEVSNISVSDEVSFSPSFMRMRNSHNHRELMLRKPLMIQSRRHLMNLTSSRSLYVDSQRLRSPMLGNKPTKSTKENVDVKIKTKVGRTSRLPVGLPRHYYPPSSESSSSSSTDEDIEPCGLASDVGRHLIVDPVFLEFLREFTARLPLAPEPCTLVPESSNGRSSLLSELNKRHQ